MHMLWGVQYLRAVAALSVLLFHASLGAGGKDAFGTGGVDIFFVISGFLMFQIASFEPPSWRFIKDRLKRIVPAYWIVTGIVAALQIVGMTERSSFDSMHLIKSLFFLPDYDVVRHQIYPLLIVGWTLNYEMFFYAIVAASLFVPQRTRLPSLVAILVTLVAAKWMWGEQSLALRFYGNSIVLEFAMGAALSELWRRERMTWPGWPLIILGALLIISPQPSILPRFIGYGVPAVMVVGGVLCLETNRRIRKISWPALLGNASYSIYLWHMFFVAATFRLLGETPPAFAIAIVGGVAIGLVSYFLIERPSIFTLRWLSRVKHEYFARRRQDATGQ
jgi:exopolysaccharide production protein ExoZ